MNVAVIGASDNPERYSYKALMLLKQAGHQVFPVHQRLKHIEGLVVVSSVAEIQEPIDTVTLYVSQDVSSKLTDDILSLKPRRIIFNPGAENADLFSKAQAQGIITLEACTLVMLRTNQF